MFYHGVSSKHGIKCWTIANKEEILIREEGVRRKKISLLCCLLRLNIFMVVVLEIISVSESSLQYC